MIGYDVVTSDDEKIGRVVDERDNCLIVEHGMLLKAKHAIPKDFATVDDDAQIVRATITKDVFADGPKVDDEHWDCSAVLAHYGLAGGVEAPDTEGYGETLPTDPAEAAQPAGERHGVTPAEQQRAEMREGTHAEPGEPAVFDRSRSAVDPAGNTANR